MTMTEAAEHLGLHPETVRRAAHADKLSYYKLQGCIRISADQPSDYLAANLCPARAPVVDYAIADNASAVAEFQSERRLRRAVEKMSLR